MRIAIIQGHPDPHGGHFGHAFARAYADGASKAGTTSSLLMSQRLIFRSMRDWFVAASISIR